MFHCDVLNDLGEVLTAHANIPIDASETYRTATCQVASHPCFISASCDSGSERGSRHCLAGAATP